MHGERRDSCLQPRTQSSVARTISVSGRRLDLEMTGCKTGRVAVLLALIFLCNTGLADVKLPGLFNEQMVLQFGQELPFWGWAEPGEDVTVTIVATDAGKEKPDTATTVAAADGRWLVRLPARKKVVPVTVTVTGKNAFTFANVLVGDVWICSGQSNMEWPVSAAQNHQSEIAEANYPQIRIFKVERNTARAPATDVEGTWIACSPETVGDTSAVAYYFGRELHQKLKRPVGLIQAAFGGANCEAWTSQVALKSDEEFDQILVRGDRASSDPNQANNPNRASVLYNGMIAPLQPYAIKGTIWYQGETNAARAYQYRKLFPAMINDWRRNWGQGDFPFLFVQLANYVPDKASPDHPPEPEESTWAELREAQAKALALPKTGMAVTIDIGEPRDIHPRNKQEVGRRLALVALRGAYRQDVIASGPMLKAMRIVDREARIEFQAAADGLVSRGETLKGFAIAGADKKFVWATARIEGAQVVVSAPSVSEPVAVRYAWGDNPECNLFNSAGLPAVPFRTDNWPGITQQNR